ncbi:pectin lyase-like protein, partial [Westerdykella ornata]
MIIFFHLLLLCWGLTQFQVLSASLPRFRLVQRADNSTAPLARNVTVEEIKAARAIVKEAIAKASKLNKARLDNPSRNVYKLRRGTHIKAKRQPEEPPRPLLDVTPEIAAAAALLAELDAEEVNEGVQKRAAGSFWMETIARRGSYPSSWGGSSGYKVFRNVKDYGARGDGVIDDTAAINRAIMDGDRCGANCNGATNKNAIVYFPAGIYLVSGTIKVVFGTQLIGDANNRPEIRAAPSFVGLGVLSTDEYVENGGTGPDGNALQWYINTSRFYGQIRNFVIDITRTHPDEYVCAIHYQVAQATSIQDVELVAKTGTTQQGMYSENGSGGVMSDITFRGGNFGFYGGNQQFTAQRMNFIGCKTAVQLIWDWGWTWKSVKISDSEVGFRLLSEGGAGTIGSVSVMDSVFSNVGTAILSGPPSQDPGTGTTGIVIENSAFQNVPKIVATTAGATLLTGTSIKHWVLGPTYKGGTRTWSSGKSAEYPREESLLAPSSGDLPDRPYFERKRDQYASASVSQFVHIKDYGAKGDGTTDDTQAVQKAFDAVNGNGKILFVDAGVYMIRDTVTIPKNAKIVGECWASFVAVGDNFSDANNPRVLLRVGQKGDIGNVELQDLIVLTKGGTAGAVLIEWNVQAENQGSAALWDVHARVGGAIGTDQNPSDCPPITSGTNRTKCQVATMLMHITPKASGFFDNMWLWVADHLIDDPARQDPKNNMDQLSIYVARGILIESQKATWLYGTASEHAVFYQYNFHKAKNIFAGMLQTEPPYFQPMPKAPEPFTGLVGRYPGDPDYSCKGADFDGCDTAWAVVLRESSNIMIAGAGTYSWFDKYTQECIDEHRCQKALWFLEKNYDNIRIQHLITIGAKYMLVSEGNGVLATDNLATKAHPQWSHIAYYDVQSNGK